MQVSKIAPYNCSYKGNAPRITTDFMNSLSKNVRNNVQWEVSSHKTFFVNTFNKYFKNNAVNIKTREDLLKLITFGLASAAAITKTSFGVPEKNVPNVNDLKPEDLIQKELTEKDITPFNMSEMQKNPNIKYSEEDIISEIKAEPIRLSGPGTPVGDFEDNFNFYITYNKNDSTMRDKINNSVSAIYTMLQIFKVNRIKHEHMKTKNPNPFYISKEISFYNQWIGLDSYLNVKNINNQLRDEILPNLLYAKDSDGNNIYSNSVFDFHGAMRILDRFVIRKDDIREIRRIKKIENPKQQKEEFDKFYKELNLRSQVKVNTLLNAMQQTLNNTENPAEFRGFDIGAHYYNRYGNKYGVAMKIDKNNLSGKIKENFIRDFFDLDKLYVIFDSEGYIHSTRSAVV